ncbi:hypothetical protein F441_15053 [Phytophthora nicotianae CJ01A1]|uniref:Uncharacterized protein n=6 Tax=Phytophthora nicotianae TaxID=4792 RepID=W2PS39_PHYN3|nr:hypothetical protein PPTG_15959 [Phytophthora nicotianae INRA-310]ETI39146.1 hypothetical protein F443_15242 [Phytophthora nicotianae P1569]ETK79366.1 hypothetical protein L915_14781 [Phytophthora nicotianae]ETO67899.1 hypothetical protein F444_15227 [Phytophthora nicotianae P1976]ETP09053.1 hypothetical protein F441_15053 [Phytophthora nicotianae CJ01A1]ETP37084.1 hypothetical protein F442_15080 [Phytophthora nicotianae P10297]KUF66942.1 hypothetical protein AM587_10016203 [Phytophthora n
MTQDLIKKKLDPNSDSTAPEQKRVRLSPPILPSVSTITPPSLPPLPPLRDVTSPKLVTTSVSPKTSVTEKSNAHKLAELRRKYLGDIGMVIQELKAVLTYGPGSASPDAPVSPSVVLKLVRTVQTLEKLQALLLMNPARLRRVSVAQLEIVEQQIKMNLLPLATLLRSFDNEEKGKHSRVTSPLASIKKVDQGWTSSDTDSPRSPSGVSVSAPPQHDWRFLSMALSLQL